MLQGCLVLLHSVVASASVRRTDLRALHLQVLLWPQRKEDGSTGQAGHPAAEDRPDGSSGAPLSSWFALHSRVSSSAVNAFLLAVWPAGISSLAPLTLVQQQESDAEDQSDADSDAGSNSDGEDDEQPPTKKLKGKAGAAKKAVAAKAAKGKKKGKEKGGKSGSKKAAGGGKGGKGKEPAPKGKGAKRKKGGVRTCCASSSGYAPTRHLRCSDCAQSYSILGLC